MLTIIIVSGPWFHSCIPALAFVCLLQYIVCEIILCFKPILFLLWANIVAKDSYNPLYFYSYIDYIMNSPLEHKLNEDKENDYLLCDCMPGAQNST